MAIHTTVVPAVVVIFHQLCVIVIYGTGKNLSQTFPGRTDGPVRNMPTFYALRYFGFFARSPQHHHRRQGPSTRSNTIRQIKGRQAAKKQYVLPDTALDTDLSYRCTHRAQ